MSTLPVLLKNPRILLLGAGRVAFQKAQVLLDNQIDFTVVSQEVGEAFSTLPVTPVQKKIEQADLADYRIVVDATGNDQVGHLLEEEKRKRNLLVNRVDMPEQCDFYFSTLLNYGRLKIAVSTDGASPTIGQEVRNRIQRVIPRHLSDIVEEKACQRQAGHIDSAETRTQVRQCLAQAFLIGCGPGDVRLLTLQAYQCLQEMDVVLYDHLISDEILNLVPAQTQKIYVGKEKGAHSFKQEQINELIPCR